MLMFVATEVMFFVALISAYLVIKAGAAGGWAPPEGVRLPILATAFNTLVLLASGVSLHVAGRHFARPGGMDKARIWYLRATVLGAFFVIFQGYEWVQLIRHGMTMLSDIFGATFFLLIGTHGLHALATIVAMAIIYPKLSGLKLEHVRALQVFWYFIVGVWPLLYGLVYF